MIVIAFWSIERLVFSKNWNNMDTNILVKFQLQIAVFTDIWTTFLRLTIQRSQEEMIAK